MTSDDGEVGRASVLLAKLVVWLLHNDGKKVRAGSWPAFTQAFQNERPLSTDTARVPKPLSQNPDRKAAVIIIIDGMTSGFKTDASLPYNHDLFESLIVKKRIKVDWEKLTTRSPLALIGSHILQLLQPGAVRITRSPSWRASSTDSTQTFRDLLHNPLQVKGWPPLCFRHSELGMENSNLFGKRWLGIRNACPNQRSFWCWTPSSVEFPVAQPKTRFLIASLRIRRHQPTRAIVLRQPSLTISSDSGIHHFDAIELIELPRYLKRSTTSGASPWIVNGAFSDCMSTSMTLHFVGAKCIPKDGMTLVSSSKNSCAFSSSSKMRTMSSAYSRSTRFSSQAI
ncbi:hypothetical protein CSKR_105021 [Clonorchis sinensis]|uniref:Uncharacterized protein n=1 Tax=Clonorchis sinensis TaxID=79923 RepID=A0A419PTA3_CLOSI|nr:hypothetical protein CSKR_105021 [Clonorchis sinensis]